MSSLLRGVKSVPNGYSPAQVKVRNATSDNQLGPMASDMADIATTTFKSSAEFYEVMDMLEERLCEKGRNWRHVLKSLKVLDYCLHQGSELVVTWVKKNIYILESLREYQYVDKEGRDVGNNIRVSANELVKLVLDDDRLRRERSGIFSSLRTDEVQPPNLSHPLGVGLRRCGPSCIFKRLMVVPHPHHSLTNNSTPREPSNKGFAHAEDSGTPFEPLRPWQTRLVQIAPSLDGVLRCSLTAVELIDMHGVGIAGTDEIVTYSAMSYVWGKQEDSCTILCNDYPVQVSRNLARFLGHLGRLSPPHSTPEYYWCDGLCIDQQNPTEKAFQVRNMLRIFEKADRVLAWISPRDSVLTLEGEPILYATTPVQQFQQLDVDSHEDLCLEHLTRAQKHFHEICNDAFFQRIWIRQEIFAARRISMCLEYQQASSDNDFDGLFWNLFRWLSLYASDPTRKTIESADPPTYGRFRVDHRFQTMVRHFQHNGTDRHEYRPPTGRRRYTVHWLRTLQEGASFQVTDPRDRVYGILGIISSTTTRLYVEDRPDIKTQDFPINYEKTVSEVYQDVVRFLINTDRNLDCLAVFEDRRNLPLDLPSWAVDWRRNVARSFIGVDASGPEERAKHGAAIKQLDVQPGQLRVEGIRFLAVRSLSAIKAWPEELLKDKAQRTPHALFNTMAWLDDGIVNFAEYYARCNHLEGLLEGDAVLHKPLRDNRSRSLQLFVPRTTMLDDVVVFLESAKCLFVLRPVADIASAFTLVGPVIGHHPWDMDSLPSSLFGDFEMQITGLPAGTSLQDLQDFMRSMLNKPVASFTCLERADYFLVAFASRDDLKQAYAFFYGRMFRGNRVTCRVDLHEALPFDEESRAARSELLLRAGPLESFVLV